MWTTHNNDCKKMINEKGVAHQVNAQKVEDLSGVRLLQNMLQPSFQDTHERVGGVHQGVARETVQWDACGGVANETAFGCPPRGHQHTSG